LGASALAGCTTSELGLEAQQLSLAGPMAGQAEADDPILPDTVAMTPSIFSMAQEQDEIGAGVAPAAYSAPAPAGASMAMAAVAPAASGMVAARSPELDALIARYADHHEIPVELLRRVVNRESTFDPTARNGPYWGLMQILPQTARTMGYQGGPEGLLDAETNLKYAGRYLRGAYLVADGDHDLAVRYYSRGYYFDAKRKGLLEATGLGTDRRRMKRDG
jgi:soluble lytic murein transglycosylase-like protein